MTNDKPNADELLTQIDDFESTIEKLKGSISSLRAKILQKKEQYGSEVEKWPNLA